MSLFSKFREAVSEPLPPRCICTYTLLGGGPYMLGYEERNDNPKCLACHPKDSK